MDKTEELLNRCFNCKDYPNDCGIYFMMALWQKECKFFRKMSKYDEFLNKINVISEEDFNQIIDALPVIDISSVNFGDLDDPDSYDEISRVIIDGIIANNTEYGYCNDVDFERKLIEIEDISSLEELENIKNIFDKWTISNYNEIVEELKEQKEIDNEEKEFSKLLDLIRTKANIEQLRKFVDEL